MLAASHLIHADVINIQRLDVLEQFVILDFRNHTERMAQHLAVIENEDRLTVIIKEGFKFLLIILCRMRFEQVRAYHMMHHIYLMQQLNNGLYISFVVSAGCDRRHRLWLVPSGIQGRQPTVRR